MAVKTQPQKRREYEYPGEAQSRFLIEWLNGPDKEKFEPWRRSFIQRFGVAFGGDAESDSKARLRAVTLLTDLKELRRVTALLEANDPLGWRALERLADNINSVLARYRRHDQIIANIPMLKAGKPVRLVQGKNQEAAPAYFWGTAPDLSATPPQELFAAQVIRELDERELLERIITCAACGRWMYARKSNQTSHSTECRREKYRQQRSRNRKHSQFLAEMQARKVARRMQ